MAKTFKVTFERDKKDPGWWIAQLHPAKLGVHSNGRTLEEARRRVREALDLALDDEKAAAAAVFDEVIEMPAAVKKLVAAQAKARANVESAQAKANELQAKAARELTAKMGLSLRDAGDLLGVSQTMVAKAIER